MIRCVRLEDAEGAERLMFGVPLQTKRMLRTPPAVTNTRSVPDPSSSDSTKNPLLVRE